MSSYVKATNFATKDTLPQGDSNKIVKGTELDNEFNAIAGAISSKADIASPSFTGTPAAPTAVFGTNTTQLATTAFVTAALQAIYPVGSIYINATSTSNPSSLIGFGTWVEFGAGRMLVGQNASDSLFDTLEETGGSKNAIAVAHTHSASSSVSDPGHGHELRWASIDPATTGALSWNAYGGTANSYRIFDAGQLGTYESRLLATNNGTGISVSTSIGSTGSSGTNANLPPYITVKMWKRTA
jgi:hypothetical protein